MAQKQTYNELVSIREMSRALMELADRLIQREQPPVSTGSCKKISQKEINKFFEHRAKTRSRSMQKAAATFVNNQQSIKTKRATVQPVAQ